MRIKFMLRAAFKEKAGKLSPLYIRLSDAEGFDQSVRTRIMILPSHWDKRSETVRSRAMIRPEDRERIVRDMMSLRDYVAVSYCEARKSDDVPQGWLAKTVDKFYRGDTMSEKESRKSGNKLLIDDIMDEFLRDRDMTVGRKKHYETLRSMIHRFEIYYRCISRRSRFVFDLLTVNAEILNLLLDYLESEEAYIAKYPKIAELDPSVSRVKLRGENYMTSIFKQLRAIFNWANRQGYMKGTPFVHFTMPKQRYGTPVYITLDELNVIYRTKLPSLEMSRQRDIFVFQCNVGCRVSDLIRLKKGCVVNEVIEYIPVKTIRENAKTVSVPLNKVAMEIIEKYADMPGDKLLPFISPQKYNDNIKEIFALAGITRPVTVVDSVTRKEKKVPINEIASSHMARRTFIGNIYRLVKDPNLVASLTGHVEGSKAFCRYRTIDIDMKRDLVKILEVEG